MQAYIQYEIQELQEHPAQKQVAFLGGEDAPSTRRWHGGSEKSKCQWRSGGDPDVPMLVSDPLYERDDVADRPLKANRFARGTSRTKPGRHAKLSTGSEALY